MSGVKPLTGCGFGFFSLDALLQFVGGALLALQVNEIHGNRQWMFISGYVCDHVDATSFGHST